MKDPHDYRSNQTNTVRKRKRERKDLKWDRIVKRFVTDSESDFTKSVRNCPKLYIEIKGEKVMNLCRNHTRMELRLRIGRQ